MNERAPHFSQERPGYKKISLDQFFTDAEIEGMRVGHFGVLPLVVSAEVAMGVLDEEAPENHYNVVTIRAGHRINLSESGSEVFVKVDKDKDVSTVYLAGTTSKGDTTVGFSSVDQGAVEQTFFQVTLTDEEILHIQHNPPILAKKEKLPMHQGDWSLVSEGDLLHVANVAGEHMDNYGYFRVSLSTPERLKHQNSFAVLPLTRVLEMSAQQVAGSLIPEGLSPVFTDMTITYTSEQKYVNPNMHSLVCQFRLHKLSDKNVSLKMIFINESTGEVVCSLYSQSLLLPPAIIKRGLR